MLAKSQWEVSGPSTQGNFYSDVVNHHLCSYIYSSYVATVVVIRRLNPGILLLNSLVGNNAVIHNVYANIGQDMWKQLIIKRVPIFAGDKKT